MSSNSDLDPMALVEEEVAGTIEDLDLHSYYQLLEVDQDATNDVIIANHWVLTREYRQIYEHPSCNGGLRANLKQILERLDEALLVLGDSRLRSSYDERLEMGETRVQIKQSSTGTFSLDDFERETADLPPGPVMPRQPAPRAPLRKQAPAPKPRPPAWRPLPQQTTGLDAIPNAPDFQELDLELTIGSSSSGPPSPEEPAGVPFGPEVNVPRPEESFTLDVEASAERSSQVLRRFMMAVDSRDVGSADVGSADVGSADVGSADAGSADADSADVDTAQLKMVGEDSDDDVTVDETSSNETSSDEMSPSEFLDEMSPSELLADEMSPSVLLADEMSPSEFLADGDTVRTVELPQMTQEEDTDRTPPPTTGILDERGEES